MRKTFWVPLLMASILTGQQARHVDDSVLRNTAKNGEEWLTYGQNPGETRYSPLKQIDATNVSRLGLAWSYDVGQGGGNQEATPLVWNGTLYSITNWSVVFAVDARTGKERWRWDPEVNQTAVFPRICCGVVNRGVAIYENMIIAPIIDGRLEALDAETGKVVWESRVAYPQENYTITMAPRIAKGKVIVGVSGSEYPVRGFFAAFDANTGHFAWKFYTVPGDPSKPFENAAMKKASETWSPEAWKMGGGATVWDGMAYDPEADLIYVGTGNAGPWPEQLRKSKGKDNLYACSVLAVRPDTGELKWYFQMVPGDSWDYDSVQQLMLVDLTIQGRQRKVLMQANKDGFYYVLDRVTGQFISGKPWVQVTWAKGLDEATGRPIVNEEAHYGKDAVMLTPGLSSYAADENFVYKPGEKNLGIIRPKTQTATPDTAGASAPPQAAPKTRPAPPAIGPTPPEGQRNILVAWDPVTQKERWHASGGGALGGGTVSTAGNLVFEVIPDGRLVAYRADTGEKLLDLKTGLHGGMGPPITYQLDGKQYISLMGGTGKVTPSVGLAPPPPTSPPGPPRLLTFVLDGAPIPTGSQ
jgi:quinohemoprotein ethanol dehydrogenase